MSEDNNINNRDKTDNNTAKQQDRGILPTENSTGIGQSGLSGKMQTVKSAWDSAPEGDKKTNAMKHYQAAEKAQKSGNDAEAMRALDEASQALN